MRSHLAGGRFCALTMFLCVMAFQIFLTSEMFIANKTIVVIWEGRCTLVAVSYVLAFS